MNKLRPNYFPPFVSGPDLIPPKSNVSFAYVWYATRAQYACSALVAMKRMKEIRDKAEWKFPFNVSYVLVLGRHSQTCKMRRSGFME